MLLHIIDTLFCQSLVPRKKRISSNEWAEPMYTKSNLFLMSARMLSCMSFCSCWISLSRSFLSASIPPYCRHIWLIPIYLTLPGLGTKKKTASSQSQSKKGTWEKELQMDKPLPLFLPPSKHWSLHGLWVELDVNRGRSTLDSWRSCYGGTLLYWEGSLSMIIILLSSIF